MEDSSRPAGMPELDFMKFRTDILYREGAFAEALERSLGVLSQLEGNEGQAQRRKEWADIAARCSLKLGQLDDAAKWASVRVCCSQPRSSPCRRAATMRMTSRAGACLPGCTQRVVCTPVCSICSLSDYYDHNIPSFRSECFAGSSLTPRCGVAAAAMPRRAGEQSRSLGRVGGGIRRHRGYLSTTV